MILKYKSDNVTPTLKTSLFSPPSRAQSKLLGLLLNQRSLPLQGLRPLCLLFQHTHTHTPRQTHMHAHPHTPMHTHTLINTIAYLLQLPLLFPRATEGHCASAPSRGFFAPDILSFHPCFSPLSSTSLCPISLYSSPRSKTPSSRKSARATPQAVRLHSHTTTVLWLHLGRPPD